MRAFHLGLSAVDDDVKDGCLRSMLVLSEGNIARTHTHTALCMPDVHDLAGVHGSAAACRAVQGSP